MRVLAVFFVLALSFAASADGFVRQREVRDYMPKYGPYQHESDITEDVLEYAGPELNIIPTNAYFTLMETDPVTHEPGCKCKVRGWLSTRLCRSERLL